MNILLTGYAGNLGTSLFKYLRNKGWTIRVLLHGAAIKPNEVRLVWMWCGVVCRIAKYLKN
jgi:nucleoside-diphosphate-sugar epimerase